MVENCPRCLARDGVRVALVLGVFEEVDRSGSPPVAGRLRQPMAGLEAEVRRQLAVKSG
jgi:hypothetical protein